MVSLLGYTLLQLVKTTVYNIIILIIYLYKTKNQVTFTHHGHMTYQVSEARAQVDTCLKRSCKAQEKVNSMEHFNHQLPLIACKHDNIPQWFGQPPFQTH